MKSKNPYQDDSMWKGAKPETFAKAKALRNKMTVAEVKLWDKLRLKKLNNYKFRRQHPILHYIVDFYYHELRLVIEVDGGYHSDKEQNDYDKRRTDILNFNGVEVLRFTNYEVVNNVQLVLHKILIEIVRIKSNK